MGLATRVARRLVGLAYLLENPRLIALRRHAGLLGTFKELNQPWLTSRNIATVLDIGAHTGLFAITIRTVFPNAQIYCFEPLPDCFESLQARMTGGGWTLRRLQCCAGRHIGNGSVSTQRFDIVVL